ncbi:LuxR family transcriptional regulator [Streptomyces antimicrobicus]|uniref:LuxR family transcriptional regulator n=1 Tax=Streptomyces antimicrobicus TaxID=2883108 RepID=A0ABS8B7I0_9ACTN|nr:LuxR family transcriptional regulator [Streptomyces antimicrobicus]MCB5180566.1 LuxR family transcriptional regulator [Streptomyces antimicrobicus]
MSSNVTLVPPPAAPVTVSPLDTLQQMADTLDTLSRYAAEAAQTQAQVPAPRPAEPAPGPPARIEYVHGPDRIRYAIHEALGRAREEILTAQPDGPRPDATLEEAYAAVRDHLSRGVAMRTLYQHSSRFHEPTKRYVQTVQRHGAQVRTLPEFFDRLIVIDRAVSFIPADAERSSAVVIRDPAVTGFLADVFEKAWDRAEPFPFRPVRAADAASEVVPDMRLAIRKLLIEGCSDKAIARRLGVSLRSVQGHISCLRDQYGAQHRFQLGYLMGRGEGALPAID